MSDDDTPPIPLSASVVVGAWRKAIWTFEPGHTEAEFRARHVMVTWVRGLFKDIHGRLEFDGHDCLATTFTGEIDATAVWTGEPARTCAAPTSSTSRSSDAARDSIGCASPTHPPGLPALGATSAGRRVRGDEPEWIANAI